MKWNCVYIDKVRRFSLEIEEESGDRFVAIPVETANHHVEYLEWYRVDADTFDRYRTDPTHAHDFVESCKRREQDHLLLLPPGTDRGWA
jgi:hypothetical protein